MSEAFPQNNQTALDAHYGKHAINLSGQPTEWWRQTHLAELRSPYPLKLAWTLQDREPTQVLRVLCHRSLVASLGTILEKILQYFGGYDKLQAAGLDQYGGCYAFKTCEEGGQLSPHAYGAAVEIGKAHDPEVVKIFEGAGWRYIGPPPDKRKPLPMRFAAVK